MDARALDDPFIGSFNAPLRQIGSQFVVGEVRRW